MPWSLNSGYSNPKKGKQKREEGTNRKQTSNLNNRIDRICYSASEYLSKYSHTEIIVLLDCPEVIRIILMLYGQDLMGSPCTLKCCFAVRHLELIQPEQIENLASAIANKLREIKPELIDEEFTVTEHDTRDNILDFTHMVALPNDRFLNCTDGRCLIVHPSELNLDTFVLSRGILFGAIIE